MSLPEPISQDEAHPATLRERRRRWVPLMMAAGALLFLGAVALYFRPSPALQHWILPPPSTAPLQFTPPPSLAELAQQYPELAPLLTEPELDSAYREFLIAYQEGGKEAAIDLARRRGLLNERDEIRVTLILDTDNSAPLVAQLEGLGIRVVAAYRDTVEIAIPLALIEATAARESPGTLFGQLTEMEHVIAVRVPALHIRQGSQIPGEGIRVVGADRWHWAGFTGAGIRVGILDMGFAGYRALLGRELPDSVVVEHFGDWDDKEVHGTACAEIIHEIAPDAELFFAWYDGTYAAEGEAVDWLLSQGVHIISHSAGDVAGPRDGTGRQSQMVNSVAAQGVLWVNSAGNWAQSHYRGTFTDNDGDGVHEFAPGQERMPLKLEPGFPQEVRVFLIWDDVWGQATRNYDLYLTLSEGEPVARSEDIQNGQIGQEPIEYIRLLWMSDETLYVAVKAAAIDGPATLDIFVSGADVAYPSPEYSLTIPADAVGALAVGATHWRRDTLEPYSSQGPTVDGRLKPEISAPAGVSTASYDEPFSGTSASAPHVAGAAALVWSAHPGFDRQQVVDFLLAHAIDLGPRGPDTGFGYGRLALPPPPSTPTAAFPSPSPIPPPVSPTETIAVPLQTPPPLLPTPTPILFTTPAPASRTSVGVSPVLAWLIGIMGTLGVGLMLAAATVWVLSRHTPPHELSPPLPISSGGQPHSPLPAPPATPPASPLSPQAQCSFCGALLRPGARFCPQCGRPTGTQRSRCSSCGASLRPGARFCPHCGRPVPAPRMFCPLCHTPVRPGARFCPRCGNPL